MRMSRYKHDNDTVTWLINENGDINSSRLSDSDKDDGVLSLREESRFNTSYIHSIYQLSVKDSRLSNMAQYLRFKGYGLTQLIEHRVYVSRLSGCHGKGITRGFWVSM